MANGKNTPPIITRAMAQILLRLFDRMYKTGVNDAAAYDDEAATHAWIERTSQPGVFGRLGDNTSDTPLYWLLKLQEAAYEIGLHRKLMDFAHLAGRYGKNYLSVAWVLTQCFYNYGLLAWWEDTQAWDLTVFNARKKVRWTRKDRNWRPSEMVSQAQKFCFERLRSDLDHGGKFALRERHYKIFIRCLGLASLETKDLIE